MMESPSMAKFAFEGDEELSLHPAKSRQIATMRHISKSVLNKNTVGDAA
jgi:hypothetical protein